MKRALELCVITILLMAIFQSCSPNKEVTTNDTENLIEMIEESVNKAETEKQEIENYIEETNPMFANYKYKIFITGNSLVIRIDEDINKDDIILNNTIEFINYLPNPYTNIAVIFDDVRIDVNEEGIITVEDIL